MRGRRSFLVPPDPHPVVDGPEGEKGEAGQEDAGEKTESEGQEVFEQLPRTDPGARWIQISGSIGMRDR